MIKAGDYTTQSGKTARIYRDSRGLGALAYVYKVGFVGYDNEGKPESEIAPAGLALVLSSWRPREAKSERK